MTPFAAGVSIAPSQRLALQGAARWYAQLRSDHSSEADMHAWQRWHDAHPDHRWAWERLRAMHASMGAAAQPLAGAALHIAGSNARSASSRRFVLRSVAGAAIAGSLGWVFMQSGAGAVMLAQHRTGTGEQQKITLPDGSQLILNTASAVNVAFSDDQRRLHLLRGEVFVQTATDRAARPFVIEAGAGMVRALGTRFTVRTDGSATAVAVYEHAVEIVSAMGQRARVDAGQQTRFTSDHIDAVSSADDASIAWTDGMLIASDWPLGTLVAELGRYRPGRLACAPEVAHLRVSGAFPLDDTDRALTMLARSLPVGIHRRTDYWVTVGAR